MASCRHSAHSAARQLAASTTRFPSTSSPRTTTASGGAPLPGRTHSTSTGRSARSGTGSAATCATTMPRLGNPRSTRSSTVSPPHTIA
ncbi:hypothetical protein [Nannocystis sp.]|uniref:hypothetical protein n=1 Tax=Nannocystis sp. TaxID=1962667 RepID=UPI0025F9C43D|nr:hypothetical protein [Nannocystis sp.]MBK7828788.1 hypothetical protein [Nannocystis sp.]